MSFRGGLMATALLAVAFGSVSPARGAGGARAPDAAAPDAPETAPTSAKTEAPSPASPGSAGPNGFRLSPVEVPVEKIRPGGPPRDGIHAVDQPELAPLSEVTWVAPDTPVLGVVVGDDARAYPVHLLEYHQIVNDVVGDVPLAVTYDPVAGCPRVVRRRVGDRTLRFGVSGLVYNASFLLYDRETESLWSQMLERAIAGPLAGTTLERVRVRQEPFAAWLERHPATRVLARPEPKRIDYRYSPFEVYWVQDEIPFPVEAQDRRFHAKEVVVGVEKGGRSRAYLGSRVTAAGGVVEDRFAGRRILIEYSPETATFHWDVPEDVEVTEAYWFAWKAFHPGTEIWAPSITDGAGEPGSPGR